jgi:hypothetical protein
VSAGLRGNQVGARPSEPRCEAACSADDVPGLAAAGRGHGPFRIIEGGAGAGPRASGDLEPSVAATGGAEFVQIAGQGHLGDGHPGVPVEQRARLLRRVHLLASPGSRRSAPGSLRRRTSRTGRRPSRALPQLPAARQKAVTMAC